ncbi:MAG: DUF2207 domain-containing protein [Bacteroidales bacterium]|nr:DUF2207 domain-containing protein [Bacteroidales bacterium]
MTTGKHRKKLIMAALAVVLLVVLCAAVPKSTAYAADNDMSAYYVSSYDIICTLNEDCTADVTEVISMTYYSGRFTRTITADGKTRIRDVKLYTAAEDDEGETVYAEAKYSVTSENKRTVKVKAKSERASGTETFVVTYRLTNLSLTKNKSSDTLFLINVGSGWDTNISAGAISLTLRLPDGFRVSDSAIFHGTWDSPDTSAEFRDADGEYKNRTFGMCSPYYDEDTNSIYYEPTSKLNAGTGVSFWLLFDKGVLSSRVSTDFIQWLIPLLVGLALLAGVLAVRFTVYKDREIFSLSKLRGLFGGKKEIPGNTADSGDGDSPEMSLDPLTYRRVLERKIEDRDVVSLFFHWAELGYIGISVKNASNPMLIKNVDRLPETCPDSWREMYDKLFERTDRVSIKSASKYIYPQIAAVREEANGKRETGYAKKPILIGCVFAFAASLCAALYPLLMPAMLSSHAMNPLYLVTMVPALLIFVFFAAIYVTRQRNTRNATIAFTTLASVYSVACVVLYCVFVPSGILGMAGKIITALLTLATVAASATMVIRSDEYGRKLGEVRTVRNFILNATPGTIEKSFEENPYLYYEYLPYALLLRIGIPWSDKFRGYTMPYPVWLDQSGQKARFAQIRDTIKSTYDAILEQTVTANTKTKKKRK